ncbi:2-hydroxy-6-oxo-6-(2'-aminophenyl)hexa-2,4-dienoic acid hydrolase [compost metagenome]
MARYQLDIPGLVVHAEDDRVVPVGDAAEIHAAWDSSRMLHLPKGGHQAVLANPEVADAVLELLERVESPAVLAMAS